MHHGAITDQMRDTDVKEPAVKLLSIVLLMDYFEAQGSNITSVQCPA